MKKEWLVKTLALGIFVLFMVINIIPPVESISIKKTIQISLPFSYSSEDTSGISLITIQAEGSLGLNNWYISDVSFSFTKQSEDIASIYYNIYDYEWAEYIEPFIIHDDGEHILKWYATNYEGNASDIDGPFSFNIDQTKPKISLTYEVTGGNPQSGWVITFTATATDDMSGMDRVEFLSNNKVQSTVCGPGPTYQWILENYKPIPHYDFKVIGFDIAGNNDSDGIMDPSIIVDILELTTFFSGNIKEPYAQIISNNVLSSEIVELENNKIIEKSPSVYTYEDVFDPAYIIIIYNRKIGENSWILSNVSINIFYESDIIVSVFYQINDGGWKVYTEPFVISDDGVHVFSCYAVDSEGYTSTTESTTLRIDRIPPEITLTKERLDEYHIKFIADVFDELSGVERVEFYLGFSNLEYIDIDFPFEWIWNITDDHVRYVKAMVYDIAGNSASSSIVITRFQNHNHDSNHRFEQKNINQQIIKLIQNLISYH